MKLKCQSLPVTNSFGTFKGVKSDWLIFIDNYNINVLNVVN